ncbi:hypothetical protein GTW69_22365 [Streptomyces sp. SID7760]|nr:hypothetical protein [Streptomyces sp. SID7760]
MCAPRSVCASPWCCRHSSLRNDTSEITSGPLPASQAEICYWAPYSLCGTKRMQKVFISPKIVTHASDAPRDGVHPQSTYRSARWLRSSQRSGADHIWITGRRVGFGLGPGLTRYESPPPLHRFAQTFLPARQPDQMKLLRPFEALG